jgi:hypothetical protein
MGGGPGRAWPEEMQIADHPPYFLLPFQSFALPLGFREEALAVVADEPKQSIVGIRHR